MSTGRRSRLADAAVGGGVGGHLAELVECDAADERQRVREPLAERHRPPARDLGVDAVVAGRCRCRWLSARDGDRADDLVVVDQERDLPVEQDLGALAGPPCVRRGCVAWRGVTVSAVEQAGAGRVPPISGTRGSRSASPVRSGRRRPGEQVAERDQLLLRVLTAGRAPEASPAAVSADRDVRGLEEAQRDRAAGRDAGEHAGGRRR